MIEVDQVRYDNMIQWIGFDWLTQCTIVRMVGCLYS